MLSSSFTTSPQVAAAPRLSFPGGTPGGPPVVFHSHEDFEFYRVDNSSYRATIYEVEKSPYVAISHWWFNRAHAAWYPSRKQIFLPKQAWLSLLEHKDRISQAILPLQEAPPAPGGRGVLFM